MTWKIDLKLQPACQTSRYGGSDGWPHLTYTNPEKALGFARQHTAEEGHPLAFQCWKTRGGIQPAPTAERSDLCPKKRWKLAEAGGAQDRQADIPPDWCAISMNQGIW
ncbi:MAG: hypothetical protein IPJ06_13520 [Saprospiraceae bacterium]|nr:hypothetical protein [Saprospiraceae bacterium]